MRGLLSVVSFTAAMLFSVAAFGQQTIVLQPGPDTSQDIWATDTYSYAPGGGGPGGGLADERLRVGGFGDTYISLIQFNLRDMPKSASSAVISLYDYRSDGTRTTSMSLFRNTKPWNWKVAGTGQDRERLWWRDLPSVVPLSATPLRAPELDAWYDIDVTVLYNSWQSGSVRNFGIQLTPLSTSDTWSVFHSSRYWQTHHCGRSSRLSWCRSQRRCARCSSVPRWSRSSDDRAEVFFLDVSVTPGHCGSGICFLHFSLQQHPKTL
jgi:hypothetical protein